MKKHISAVLLSLVLILASLVFLANPVFSSEKLTIKNTVGSDSDLFDYDAYTWSRVTDTDGNDVTQNNFAFGDRFQIDYDSKVLDARFRLDMFYHYLNDIKYEAASQGDAIPSFVFAPSVFVHYRPIKQIGFIVGNKFFSRFDIKSAYLAAADDTTKYGKLVTDSLGYDIYYGNEYCSLYNNGFAGAITSDWKFGLLEEGYLNFAGGVTVNSDFQDDTEYALDFGIDGGIVNIFDCGFTAHNVLSDYRKFGAFLGLTTNPDLVLNAQFYYNFTDSDYLAEERVTKSSGYKYKKQTTKYALGLSGGYKFSDIGLGIYADAITGLTNEYIGEIYFYENGELVETRVVTLVRSSCIKYKNGKATSKTDGYTHEGIPFYTNLRLTYVPVDLEELEASFNIKLRTMWNVAEDSWITFYPRLSFDLPSNAGTLAGGLKIDMNLARYSGVSDISVPFTYTYKWKKKF